MTTPASRRISQTSAPFFDHAGQPAQSFWLGGASARPSFSFQVYPITPVRRFTRFPSELFSDDASAWRCDVYSPQLSLWSSIEHQQRERDFRNAQPNQDAAHDPIPESYTDLQKPLSIMARYILVVDCEHWYWATMGDENNIGGPLGVWFSTTRPEHEQWVVERELTDGNEENEQLELQVGRLRKALFPNYDLKEVWKGAGEKDWDCKRPATPLEDKQATTITTTSATPFHTVAITHRRHHGVILTTGLPSTAPDADFDLIYTICPTFTTTHPLSPAELTSLGRRFLAYLLTPACTCVRLHIGAQQSSIGDCIDCEVLTTPRLQGYVSPYATSPVRRRFPEYGFEARMLQMQKHPPRSRYFVIVLDREDWEVDGVCFVWSGATSPELSFAEVLVARVRGRMRVVTERLRGER